MSQPKQAVILCGGLGTRLSPYTDSMPKPMISCNGKPFLWYLIQQLHEQKINRFVLLTGYLSEKINEYFGDGSEWGWQIEYSEGPVEWDTGRRLWESKEKLDNTFLMLYSDNFVPFPLQKVLAFHKQNHKPLTFMVAAKSPGNISLNKEGIVNNYDYNRSDADLNYVEIGYMIIEKDKIFSFYEHPDCSFSTILYKMAAQHQISGWIQNDQYHSISDPERWKETEEYLKDIKIILIDRDGVINKKAPQGEYITKWEEFRWIPETRTAMKLLAKEGFRFIVISNQAGVARGMVDQNELNCIHKKMKDELLNESIQIIDIYVCPHHWNEGCSCRKPKPGMMLQASREHLLRLDKTLFIGDDIRDCQTAENAGCESIFVGKATVLATLPTKEHPICHSPLLTDCLPIITEYFHQ